MTEKEIASAWKTNPDGAGLWHDGRVFKSMDEKAFKERCSLIDKDDEAVYHFRIATQGTKKKENCHPFNIGNNMTLFHNGVLPFHPTEDITDSEFFGRYILNPAIRFWPLSVKDALDKCREAFGSTSKLALVRQGKIYLSGYFQDHRGLKCSNLYWVPYEKPAYTTLGKVTTDGWKNSGKSYKENYPKKKNKWSKWGTRYNWEDDYGYGNNYGNDQDYYSYRSRSLWDDDDYNNFKYGWNDEEMCYGYWDASGVFYPYAY